MKKLLFFLSLSFSCAYSQNDALILKTGQSINCSILNKNDTSLLINVNSVNLTYLLKSVEFYKWNSIWYNSDGKLSQQTGSKESPGVNKLLNIKIQDELTYMRKNLKLYNDYCYGSYVLLLAGSGMAWYGITNIKSDTTSSYQLVNGVKAYDTKKEIPVALYAAGVCFAAGMVMQLYCHRFIGKAGIGIGGKGVVVNYTF